VVVAAGGDDLDDRVGEVDAVGGLQVAANRSHGIVEASGVGDPSAAREALALDVELPPVRPGHRVHDESAVGRRMALEGNAH
jgi:hypothetical protein